LLKVFNL